MTEKTVLLTTSRRPTKNMRTFCKDFSHSIPNVIRTNRGKLSLDGVAEKALELNLKKVIIVDRWKGGPGKLKFFEVTEKGLNVLPPTVYIRSVKLRRDFGNMPRGRRVKSVSIKELHGSLDVQKLGKAFSEFFEIPILSLREAANRGFDALMEIADEANCINLTFRLIPELIEVGPQLKISHLIWESAK
ncbi:hypothetical protein CW708_01475 [Candidatus Bathyarchaeota archaeon]|nr:MAG: hypothetical protein CW708_01475 [Candidatus Bathyarchaeota archaeon]